MRILIHALAALENGGSDRHLRGMVSVLGKVYPEIEYIIYVNPSFHLKHIPENVEVRTASVSAVWQRLWWDQIALPRIVRREGIDVIWATLYFGSLWSPVPQIMFQRNVMYYCDYYLDDLDFRDSAIVGLRRWLLYRIMHASYSIITPTGAMRDMIRAKHPDIPTERFKIVPHAFDLETDGNDLPVRVKQRLASSDPLTLKLLYVGHLVPFKGLFHLLDAFAQVIEHANRMVKLFLTIAREDWPEGFDRFVSRVTELGLTQHVEILGKLRGQVMAALYQGCDVLVYPSLCESFGFPLLEAMNFSVPIVAADTAVNREVAGDGAIYYSPMDIGETVEALLKIVDKPDLRRSLGTTGRIRFENIHLCWDEYVRQCVELSQLALHSDSKGKKR